MAPQDCYYRTSIKGLVVDEKKRFLLIREENGLWELPGGGLNFGESPQDCLAREIREEMGVNITWMAEKPSYFFTVKNINHAWILNIIFEIKISDLDFTPSPECMEIGFFSANEAFSVNLYPNVREFVRLYSAENSTK